MFVIRVMAMGNPFTIMTQRQTIEVSGMACTGCERNVENTLKNIAGVRRVEADHETGSVEVVVEDGASEDDLTTAIHDAGYEVVA